MEIKDKNLINIFDKLKENDARLYLVGGYVRDNLLGLKSKDLDIEVFNISLNELEKITKGIKNEKFGIVTLKEYNLDLAIPREEIKVGNSYNDFLIKLNPNLDLKKAAKRRDFSINAIMYDIYNDKLIDNYNGIEDLNNKTIKHISEKFSEDPLRVLRAIRFSTNLNFKIDTKTLNLCYKMLNDLKFLSVNKKESELNKILSSNNKYLLEQEKSLKLLFSYIGEVDFIKFKEVCLKKSNYQIQLIKVIMFDKSQKIDEFISNKKEKLKIQKIIEYKNKLNYELSKEEMLDIYLEIKHDYDLFLEVLILFKIDNNKIEILRKINNLYYETNWKNLFDNKEVKNKLLLKRKYLISQINK